MSAPDASLADDDYCYLTTTGRVTGAPRTIEIWFALEANVLYMLAGFGPKADWVRNFQKTPNVHLRIRDVTYEATARVIDPDSPEDALARRLLVSKYAPRHHNDLESWGRDSLPCAFDFVE